MRNEAAPDMISITRIDSIVRSSLRMQERADGITHYRPREAQGEKGLFLDVVPITYFGLFTPVFYGKRGCLMVM